VLMKNKRLKTTDGIRENRMDNPEVLVQKTPAKIN
jgi:hypothetical protein